MESNSFGEACLSSRTDFVHEGVFEVESQVSALSGLCKQGAAKLCRMPLHEGKQIVLSCNLSLEVS